MLCFEASVAAIMSGGLGTKVSRVLDYCGLLRHHLKDGKKVRLCIELGMRFSGCLLVFAMAIWCVLFRSIMSDKVMQVLEVMGRPGQ
jgi:hypothetical protein